MLDVVAAIGGAAAINYAAAAAGTSTVEVTNGSSASLNVWKISRERGEYHADNQ